MTKDILQIIMIGFTLIILFWMIFNLIRYRKPHAEIISDLFNAISKEEKGNDL